MSNIVQELETVSLRQAKSIIRALSSKESVLLFSAGKTGR